MKQKTVFATGVALGLLGSVLVGAALQPAAPAKEAPIVGSMPKEGTVLVIDSTGRGWVVDAKGDMRPVGHIADGEDGRPILFNFRASDPSGRVPKSKP